MDKGAGTVLKTIGGIAGVLFLWNQTKRIPYTRRWFETVSDEELSKRREPIRKKAVYDGDPTSWSLLEMIDREQIRRATERFEREHPNAQPRHREHGWYLPNDE